jgi:hypothetical protein
VRRDEILVIDAKSGRIEGSVQAPADNAQIVRIAKTGAESDDWTLMIKNSESAYPPHEYANPIWFYSPQLELIRTADFLGAGHAPLVEDIDEDGLDEFLIGFNAIDHDLKTLWTFEPVPEEDWDPAEMHVDFISFDRIGERLCVALAASDHEYLLDAKTGELLWKRKGTHPQSCLIGRFNTGQEKRQVLVHNKRADLQLYDSEGNELWRITPPSNFPLGQSEACKRQAFHTFDPITLLPGRGATASDWILFSDSGWPYGLNGQGVRCLEFPVTPQVAQDWGEVPGRPDDYGYGYYVRVIDPKEDGEIEVLINDRRYLWRFKI